jgi:hypothetical protein
MQTGTSSAEETVVFVHGNPVAELVIPFLSARLGARV